MALRGEEGRNERRNSTGSSKYATIRRNPNGGTRHVEDMTSRKRGNTQRTEISKYLQEKKVITILLVVTSERGTASLYNSYKTTT